MVREVRKKSRDIEEAEKVRSHPEKESQVEEDTVGRGFSLSVREGGGFKGIARRCVQDQKRVPPSLPNVAQRWSRDNRGMNIEVSSRRRWMGRNITRRGDVHVGICGRVPPAVAEWLGLKRKILFEL